MQISPARIFGNCGWARSPERLMKSDGMRMLVRKLRLCQSGRGRKRTRVEGFAAAPSADSWRTTFLRLFFEKGIGTFAERYKLVWVNQSFSAPREFEDAIITDAEDEVDPA